MQVAMAAASEASGPSPGSRPCRSRAIASIISIRNTASARGVRIGAIQVSAAPVRITAINTRALRVVSALRWVLGAGAAAGMRWLSARRGAASMAARSWQARSARLRRGAAADDVGSDDDVEVGLRPIRVLGVEQLVDQRHVADQRQLGMLCEIALLGQAADDEALTVSHRRRRRGLALADR